MGDSQRSSQKSSSFNFEHVAPTTASTSEFFANDENFPVSVGALVTLGVAHVLILALPLSIATVCTMALALFIWEWNSIHAHKMTRREIIFFDERNLLETSTGLEFYSAPILKGTTPAFGGPGVDLSYPKTLWEALFSDEDDLKMQKFYREHYGPVWSTAQKHEREMKLQQKIENEDAPKSDSSDKTKTQ